MDIYKNPNENLVFWNTLGGYDGSNKPSRTGPNITDVGTPGYDPNGKFGYAYENAGLANYFDIDGDYDDYLDPAKGTVEFWWKPATNYNSNLCFFCDFNISTVHQLRIYSHTSVDGNLHFNIYRGTGQDITYPQASIVVGTWYHIAGVWDIDGIAGSSDTMRFYIDGTQVAQTTSSFGTDTLTGTRVSRIGEDVNANGRELVGAMDNMKIYDYAKIDFSDREAEGLSDVTGTNIQLPPDKRLILWNKLGSTTEVENSEIGPNGTEINTVSYAEGKHGDCLVPGSLPNNGVDFLGIQGFSRQFTIDFDFIIPGTIADLSVVIGHTGNATSSPYGVSTDSVAMLVVNDSRAGQKKLWFYFYPYGSTRQVYWNISSDVTQDVWHHIKIIVDADGSDIYDKLKLYLDGSIYNNVAPIGNNLIASDWTNMAPLTRLGIGHYSGLGSTQYDGARKIDNLKIYNYIELDTHDSIVEGNPTISEYDNNIYDNPNKHIALWNKLGATEEVENSEVGKSFVESSSVTYDSGKFGSAFVGASNQYLQLDGDHATFMSMYRGCFEMWYYPTTGFNNSLGQFFAFTSGGPYPNLNYVMAITHSNGSTQFFMRNPDSAVVTIPDTDTIFTINTWHHVACVYDLSGIDDTSDTMRMYVDGVDVGSTTAGAGSTAYPANPVARIGNDEGTDNWYIRGRIDNFKYYNYAKTDFSDRFIEAPVNISDLDLL